MGSCAAPSAKGDDKFITTDYLQQCREDYKKKSNGYYEIKQPAGFFSPLFFIKE
ncbi:putative transposase [Raoultella ornithinolytica 2-156-04_S1_C2]|nr:putative transposase [Raoultella ornithinolytica 2-156-04_S1_C1]KDX16433.1 putative transposase [Raoultella ornithinolytica 2-156-04_S1_C2]